MRLAVLLVLVSALLPAADPVLKIPANLKADGIPPIPATLLERLDQYGDFRAATLEDWHPTRRELILTTRFGNTNQVHHVATPGGARSQLTFRRDRVLHAHYRPGDGGQILYESDSGGGEWYQFYLLDRTTGRSTLLTDGKSRNQNPRWSRDGKWLAFTSTRRNNASSDLWVLNPDDPSSARMLLAVNSGGWDVCDWSPDGKTLAVVERRSVTDGNLHLVDVATGALRTLSPEGRAYWADARFRADGKEVYAVTDWQSNFRRVAAIPAAGGPPAFWTNEANWDASSPEPSPDGRFLAYLTNEDGFSVVHVRDLAAGRTTRLSLPKGVINDLRWHANSKDLGFSLVSARHPSDVFSVNIDRPTAVERWTRGETGGLDSSRFREPELIHWNSFDNRRISGFLYLPAARFTGPRPVIINIHGGPEGQSRPNYLGRTNYYLEEMGIAVIYPNVRGSLGYGKEYVSLDNGYRREDSVKDIGALLDWIATRKDLDAGRVMVTGGSYGGYMTLASMTHFNDRLRCGVESVGISNWVTFLKNTEAYRRDLRRVEYGDERDPKMRDFLETISPLSKVSRIRKPMFVIQGRNDPRVPYTESEQVVSALRQQGTPAWYLLADDEGHGFSRKGNQDVQQAATVLFVERYLLP